MCFKQVQECILPNKIKLGVGCTFKNSSENHTKVVHNMHGTHYPHLITLLWALQEDKHLLRLFSVLLLDAFLSPHQMTFLNFRFAMHLKQIPKTQLLNLSGAFRSSLILLLLSLCKSSWIYCCGLQPLTLLKSSKRIRLGFQAQSLYQCSYIQRHWMLHMNY